MDPQQVLMPPLYIIFGFMKQFVKVLDKELENLKNLRNFFLSCLTWKSELVSYLDNEKKKIVDCDEFPKKLTSKNKAFRNSFVAVDWVYGELVESLGNNFSTVCGGMSLRPYPWCSSWSVRSFIFIIFQWNLTSAFCIFSITSAFLKISVIPMLRE